MRRRVLLLSLLALAVMATSASAQMGVLYDDPTAVEQIVQGPSALSPEIYNLFQQQPSRRVLAVNRQVGKVSSRPAVSSTPSLAGLSAGQMASLLRTQINRAGGRMVFIDEMGSALKGSGSHNLAEALRMLSLETLNGVTLNRRVHIYVQGSASPIYDAGWDDSWAALALSGGVWWQSYFTSRTWNEAEWSVWPRLITQRLVAAGSDPSLLHWMIRQHPGASLVAQNEMLRRGDACVTSLNGLGAWRVGPEAAFFADTVRQLATEGAAACIAAPYRGPAIDSAWGQVADLERGARVASGLVAAQSQGSGLLKAGQLPRGRIALFTANLGPDPLGIAAALQISPTDFWNSAAPQLRIQGAGINTVVPIAVGQPTLVYATPKTLGKLTVTLSLSGTGVRGALGGPGADPLVALERSGYRLPALAKRITQSPGGFRVNIPLTGASRSALFQVVAPAPAKVAHLRLSLPGLASRGVTKRHRPLIVLARDARGKPIVGARLALRLPNGKSRRITTGAKGQARVLVARLGGRYSIKATNSRVSASVKVGRGRR